MSCKKIKYTLSEYLDGQLAAKEAQKIENHLKVCISCSTLFEDLKNYRSLISSLEHKQAPINLEENVLKRISDRPKERFIIPTWIKTVAIAALLVGFFYFIFPYGYFEPVTIETEYIPVMPKSSKGPKDKKGASIEDSRIIFICKLTEKFKGKVLHLDYQNSGMINSILIKIPKNAYPDLAREYNQSGTTNKLNDSEVLSIRRQIRLMIYMASNAYAIFDFNNDGFDDIFIHQQAGKYAGKILLAINDRLGGFKAPIPAELPENLELINEQKNIFKADLIGNGTQLVLKKNIDGWEYYKDSSFSEAYPLAFEQHASGYPMDFMIFFGDFNGDGFDDIIAKNGNSSLEGVWFISLNNGNLGFKRGYETYFGNSKFLSIGDPIKLKIE